MTDDYDPEAEGAEIDQADLLRRAARLTTRAENARQRADEMLAERTEIVDELVAAGVPITQIAQRCGVTHGALQIASKRAAAKRAEQAAAS